MPCSHPAFRVKSRLRSRGSFPQARDKYLSLATLFGDAEPPVLKHSLNTIRTAAATLYEANIHVSLSLGGMQRRKALGKHAQSFVSDYEGANPADWIHPVLIEAAKKAA